MSESPIAALGTRYANGARPTDELPGYLSHSSTNASHNTYLAQDTAWSLREAASLPPAPTEDLPLYGLPISLKDCFDLAGFPTSSGSRFYQQQPAPTEDSAIAARLRARGAVIAGKTHLHQLAYGITGENPDFGPCLQPDNATLLTGGSSSGAAASIQEGSAIAAIGTDTGGSIRTPAALCGLTGFRVSQSVTKNLWRGGHHLAPTFDTLGLLYRDLRDTQFLAHSLFDIPTITPPPLNTLRIGVPATSFFHDCDPDVLDTLNLWLTFFAGQGSTIIRFDPTYWHDAFDIFSPIQAAEAAALHAGNYSHFDFTIADRLRWGATLTTEDLTALRTRHAAFEQQTAALFTTFDFLLLPATPATALYAHADQSQTRARILRYTVPVSLARLPAITLPPILQGTTTGLQLASPIDTDANLFALATALHQHRTT